MASESTPNVSVVIPVYNEAAIVERSTRELVDQLDHKGWNYEILLSENG